MDPWKTPAVVRLIELALDEDAGRGDLTTAAVVPEGARACGSFVAREELVVAGLPVLQAVFDRIDKDVRVDLDVDDGDWTEPGVTLARIEGSAASILTGERTALNFLQRLSGIATTTRRYVERVAGTNARIADTRKTIPGFRALEKYAVRMGGGANHRFDLASGVLIKDNHIAVVGSVAEAVRRARASAPHGMKIEVEVDDLHGLDEALEAKADAILLDNFDLESVALALQRIRQQAPATLVEVSGGVSLSTVLEIARLGVDLISIGALTHSSPAVDIALDFEMVLPGQRGRL